MKKNVLGVFFIALMIFGLLFGVSFPNGFSLGDKILSSFGAKIWSNGTNGLHYSAIYSLIIIIIAWTGINIIFGKMYPKVTKGIALILFLLFITKAIIKS